ncbi:MAG TPA: hypothetical protein DCL15_15390 [Chloroflexi bacterium]|nr:hypothetical protein [Chloroflexota bacterium]
MTTRAANFVHLNVHSWYSLLSATASVEALAARAAQDGMTHLALTDTNVLYGAVAFQRACLAAGVQPIIGMTATVAAPNSMTLQQAPNAAAHRPAPACRSECARTPAAERAGP